MNIRGADSGLRAEPALEQFPFSLFPEGADERGAALGLTECPGPGHGRLFAQATFINENADAALVQGAFYQSKPFYTESKG